MLACLCTLKTAYTKHLKYVKRKIETKRGAVEIPVSYTHLGKRTAKRAGYFKRRAGKGKTEI